MTTQTPLNQPPQSSRKVFVLDTNILLVDPEAIYRFEDNTVVITMTVLEELDGLKKRSHTEYEARQAINKILELTTRTKPGEPITLANGGCVILDSDDAHEQSAHCSLDASKADNRIIATAIKYRDSDRFPNRVVIVTNDSAVRVKAHALRIASEEYQAVNFTNGVEELYQAPTEITLRPEQVNEWAQGKAIDWNNGVKGPVLVKLDDNQVTPGYIRNNQLHSYGALASELIRPLNTQQELALHMATDLSNKIVAITGHAGTGKTILALAVAIEHKLLHNHPGKVYIFRPNDQLADEMGFLPGTLDDKFQPFKRAIRDAYEILQQSASQLKKVRKLQDFESLTNDLGGGKMPILPINYIRGSTLNDAYIIIDEAQNFTAHQMKTLLTRAGRNTRVIITGDPDQIDNRYITKRSCGLTNVIGKLQYSHIFAHVNLTQGERSEIASIAAELL